MKYSYKLEDYGGGKTCYVIYKSGKAIFHSNGFSSKVEAVIRAKSHVLDYQMEESL